MLIRIYNSIFTGAAGYASEYLAYPVPPPLTGVAEPLLAFLGQPQYYQKAVYKALRITTMYLNQVIYMNRFDVSGL